MFNWVKIAIDFLKTPRFNPMDLTTRNKSVMCFNLSFLFSRDDLKEEAMNKMIQWVESGKLKVLKVNEFKFWEVAKAHQFI